MVDVSGITEIYFVLSLHTAQVYRGDDMSPSTYFNYKRETG